MSKTSAVKPRKPKRAEKQAALKPRSELLQVAAICAVLITAVLCTYSAVAGYGFVNFDDDLYVTLNDHVRNGLTWENLKWAMSSVTLYYWHPLTWISHMADTQLFGMDAGPRHFENVCIHAINAALLFVVLRTITRRFWPCAFVAAAFALHPLRVESVAWIAERKDVLSGFFWLLTTLLYVPYAKKQTPGRYMTVLASFALGIMAKPMLVTLPLVLLLLDYWPLNRTRRLSEKGPMLAIAIAASVATVHAQASSGATTELPLPIRLENAVSAYVTYIGMLIWPRNLAVLYPYRTDFPSLWIAFCVVLLTAITVAVIYFRRRWPYLFVGWFWYVIALLPTVGLIQVGAQAIADRFTYIPTIGILIAVVWFIADHARQRRALYAAAAACVLAVLAWRTTAQLPVWKSSVTLFSRAVEVAPESHLNQHNLGYALAQEGRYQEAIPHYQESLRLEPRLYKADYNLGRALYETGKPGDAVVYFKKALSYRLDPSYESDIHNALGMAFAQQRDFANAGHEFMSAIALKPQASEPHANMGSLFAMQGRLQEAVPQFLTAIQLQPGSANAHRNLGFAYAQLGRKTEAVKEFQTVLNLEPGDVSAQRALQAINASGPR